MPLHRTLGLSVGVSRIQAVVLEHEGPHRTLLAIDEWENTLPLIARTNGNGTAMFTERLSGFLSGHGIRPDHVSIAFDSSRLFINTIPIEEGISRLERNEHIRWELSQYFPDSRPGDFITDVQPMTDNRVEKWVKTLSVSVRKSESDLLQGVLMDMGLDLHIIDVDHFSADAALRHNYPDTERKYMALAGIKENRLDISLLRNGVLEQYRYHQISSNSEIVEAIATLSRETRGLYSVTAYGTDLDMDLLVLIRRGSILLVEAMNPLRHVRVADSLRLSDHLTVPSYRFAAAIGVALRQD
jgi:Tfp pilus assembly PilM family ATPase